MNRLVRRGYATGSVNSTRSLFDMTLLGIGGASILGFLMYRGSKRDAEKTSSNSFTVPVISQTGSQETKTLSLLTSQQADSILRQNESTHLLANHVVKRYDTNHVASNSPIEDDSCCVVYSQGDAFFGIFDGHSGWQTSKYLSSELVPSVVRELASAQPGLARGYLSFLGSKPEGRDVSVHSAMKRAFAALDEKIVQAPLALLKDHKLDVTQLLPAISGSCALLSYIDAKNEKVHVAVAGDSRAVMGQYDESTHKWKCIVLSEDQTGRSESEIARIRKEHPGEERTCVFRGRVLGSLEPTRSFGDARYKWPLSTQTQLLNSIKMKATPRYLTTPPYVTAVPEVQSFDLHGKRSFIVLGTDGLYDRLSNEEVVALVGASLDHTQRGTVSRETLLASTLAPPESKSTLATSHVPHANQTQYSFADDNLSTHLIRNALGGAHSEQVSVMLSIPAPLSRRYRDDITVTVVVL